MAALPSDNIDQVWTSVMSNFSNVRASVPINKNQLRALLVLMDSEIESAEISIIQALPAGDGKSWLIANAGIGRELMSRIIDKRQEVL